MNYYEEFGLGPSATADEIRHAHRNLARVLHPDNFQDEHLRRLADGQMKRINSMYLVLSDPAQRRRYDAELVSLHGSARKTDHAADPPTKLPWIVAAAGVLFGLHAWLQPPREKVVVVEAPARVVESPATPVAKPSAARPGETPMARREPSQWPRSTDGPTPHVLTSAPPRSPARIESPSAAGVAAVEETHSSLGVPATVPPPPAGLTGRWLFIPSSRPSPKEAYAAEYIELVLEDLNETLRGRYRARYRVADQALSPDVQFQFEGRSGANRFPWRGNGGASGEVQLSRKAENLLAVSWFTTAIGGPPSLTSGTAVLMRAEE